MGAPVRPNMLNMPKSASVFGTERLYMALLLLGVKRRVTARKSYVKGPTQINLLDSDDKIIATTFVAYVSSQCLECYNRP